MAGPAISVIIPVYNSAEQLVLCLHAIRHSLDPPEEIIVVDDASTDDSASVAEGVKLIACKTRSGPAAARNLGVSVAANEILFFVDADVCIHPDAVGRVRSLFAAEPAVAAVIGSYDDEPASRNFLSQYRNLMHAFYHRSGNTEATTFWTGCGAVRAAALKQVGGFDAQRYPNGSIEDIEVGYRMHAAGLVMRLDPALQGKHLKHWTFSSILRTDLFARAIPWTELILSHRRMPDDLNVRGSQRASVALVGLAGIALLLLQPVVAILLLAILTGLNLPFYSFLAERRGWLFALQAVPLHWLYFLYSGLGFILGATRVMLRRH